MLFESQGQAVQLLLLDGLGREVRRVVDGRVLGCGPQRVPVSVAGLAPGTYHCVVRAGDRRTARRLVVAS